MILSASESIAGRAEPIPVLGVANEHLIVVGFISFWNRVSTQVRFLLPTEYGFRGIFCCKTTRNFAEFRMYLHTEFRR
jgi:hypothetical protein